MKEKFREKIDIVENDMSLSEILNILDKNQINNTHFYLIAIT